MKKRLLSIILAAALVLGLSSCTIKLSTTSIPAGTPEPENTANTVETTGSIDVPVRELTLEEKMEQKTTIELVKADIGSDSYIAPAQDLNTHLWGYIDLSGNWIIRPQYKSASVFSEGVACVCDIYEVYFFIDGCGNALFDGVNGTPVLTASASFSEGAANIHTNTGYVQTMTYVDAAGAIPYSIGKVPLAKGVSYKTSKYVELATPFRNGKAVVMRTTNDTLTALGYARLESAYVIDGNVSILAAYPQGMDVSSYGFDENMRIVVKAETGLYGLADEYGNILINPAYLRVLHCEGDLYLVCNQNGFWGFFDKNGNMVIDFIYNNAYPFSEGLAAVSNGTKWGFIDETGILVIPYIYDNVQPLKTAGSASSENNGAFSSGIAMVQAGRYWGAIDSTGEILFAAEADTCPVISISNGYISFEYNGGCGVFTTDGKLVLLPEFERIGEFR